MARPRTIEVPKTPAEIVRSIAWDMKIRANAFASRCEAYSPEQCAALVASLTKAGAITVSDEGIEVAFVLALVEAMKRVGPDQGLRA